jgi:hypothetical protein
MWKLASIAVALSACVMIPAGPTATRYGHGQPQAQMQSETGPEFPAVRKAIDDADALVASDPAAAEKQYVRARAALLKLWGEQQGGDMPNNRIMRAFGHIDSAREGSATDELMWRTFLGRSRALEALGRQEELLGELPDHSLDGHTCWGALASQCQSYVAHVQQTFPDSFVFEHGKTFMKTQWHVDAYDMDRAMFELPDLQKKLHAMNGWVLIHIPVSSVSKGANGRTTIKLVGEDLGIRYAENCKKYLKRELAADGSLQVEERCENVHHEVERSNTLVISARAAGELPPHKPGDLYTIAVPAAKLASKGHTFTWSDAVVLRVNGAKGVRYWYGANLDWSLGQVVASSR